MRPADRMRVILYRKVFGRRRTSGHTKHRWHLVHQLARNCCDLPCVLASMQYDRVIRQALCDAQDILWANLPPSHNLTDDGAVAGLRAGIAVPAVQEAIEQGNDTALCFVLRAVNHILTEQSESPRRTIDRLWNVLDDRELNGMLGLKQNARMFFRRKKPPAL
jgi:hypothetical protein